MECCGAGKTCCLTESGGEMKHAGSWNVVVRGKHAALLKAVVK
jgi:hypothetical protein